MHTMERSEPSLTPEWMRNNGGGNQCASSQSDGPVLALPVNRSLKSIGNSDSSNSPLIGHSNSSNSRRSSVNNGFTKHDKNSYARSYSSFSRSHRDKDRERSSPTSSWDSDYPDPLSGMINGRAEDPLRRSQSMISSRNGNTPQRRINSDLKNGIHKNHDNGIHSDIGNVTGIHKVSFEMDFPVLKSEERPKTPDVLRVSSPGPSRGVKSLSIGNPPSVGGEGWTSALADIPTDTGSNNGVGSTPALNMAEALVLAPAQSPNTPQASIQMQKDELAIAQCKKLIPVTPLSKTTVLGSSDKLKHALTPNNGVHHLSPVLVGSQPVRGASIRVDDPKSPSGKLLVLKPGRENGVSPGLKDLQISSTNFNLRVANGQSTVSPTASALPSNNLHNPKSLPGFRKISGNGISPAAGVDKRTSRSNFFKLVREKSLNSTCGPTGSGTSTSLDAVDELGSEAKDLACALVTPAETRSEVKCDGKTCTMADNLSPSMKINNEEERAFLLSLGWEDNAEDGEEGLTKEEIEAFYNEVIKQGATSRLCRLIQAKLISHVGCSSSNDSNTSVSQAEA